MTRPAPLPAASLRERFEASLLAPIRGFRLAHLPLILIYFAQGALGLTAVADTFWVRKSLTLSPAELASIAVWLQLPWSIKMVISELVDAVAILGSRRRIWIFMGSGMIAAGLAILAGAAAQRLTFWPPERLYVLAQLLVVLGAVVQEVVADAISAEVVARQDDEGTPRPKSAVDGDLAMVQVLARLAYSAAACLVAALAGRLAEALPYHRVFEIALIIPAVSMLGAFLVRLGPATSRAIDWRILGGGLVFASVAVGLGLSALPLAQEAVALIAITIIGLMMRHVLRRLDPELRMRIVALAAMVFAFRAAPTLGEGYRWFLMDRLGFDERFFGTLQLTGMAIGLAAMWLMVGFVMRTPVVRMLLWLTALATLLWLPSLMIVSGAYAWTEAWLGLGPRAIALVDEAAQTPLALLVQVPLLALIAIHAPPAERASWFALFASLMSVAIVVSQLVTKYLNLIFPIARGEYAHVTALVLGVIATSLLLPLTAIALVGRRAR